MVVNRMKWPKYLHKTTLILVKGALDAHRSKLMDNKNDFGYRFS